jgi:hypothetical protein
MLEKLNNHEHVAEDTDDYLQSVYVTDVLNAKAEWSIFTNVKISVIMLIT